MQPPTCFGVERFLWLTEDLGTFGMTAVHLGVSGFELVLQTAHCS